MSLTPSDHNGYGISCFGARDGSIVATVSGGQAPYTYRWSNGDTLSSIGNVAAGYYHVVVTDANSESKQAEITLVQPDQLLARATPFEYPNEYNISCHQCFNGSIDVLVQGGVTPYTYLWRDGVTTEDRYGLGARDYQVNITDLNGCEFSVPSVTLREPQRSDWTMHGNAGTDPNVNYIGSSDNRDVVLKSNGTDRLRLLSNGDIHMNSLTNEIGLLFRGPDGILKIGDGDNSNDATPCWDDTRSSPYWRTNGNMFGNICPNTDLVLGTKSNRRFDIITNDIRRIRVNADGQVAIGEDLSNPYNGQGRLSIQQGWGNWLAFHHSSNTGFWSFHNGQFEDRISLMYKASSTAEPIYPITVHSNGKVAIGTNVVTLTDWNYGLYVHDGILTERVKVALRDGEWSDFVFHPNYSLMSFDELKKFIEDNGHLPGVPSECEMIENGLDVAKSDAILLMKIEELTLYILELSRQIEDLKNSK